MDQFPHDPGNGPNTGPDVGSDDRAADDPARNRNEVRDSLFLMADLRIAGQSKLHHVRVRNLSAGGLMAELPNGLAQGVEVDVDVRGIGWVTGHVAWSAAGRIGVAFVSPIDPMLARKPVTGAAKSSSYVAAKVSVKPPLMRR